MAVKALIINWLRFRVPLLLIHYNNALILKAIIW